jgi:hypothetical protein
MMSFVRYFAALMAIGIVSWATPDTPTVKVLVLDALNGEPEANVHIFYLCDEIPHATNTYSATDATGIALVPYTCHAGIKLELSAVPQGRKEGCGGGVGATLAEIESTGVISDPTSAGGIWCPTKVSQKLQPMPGQVVLFVKKPTWYQAHVAG